MPADFRVASCLLGCLFALCSSARLTNGKRIFFRDDLFDQDRDFGESLALSSEVSQSGPRTSTEIEVMLGSNHLNKIIRHVLLPWLDGLFSKLKIPDIQALKVPGITLNLQNLMIEKLDLQQVQVLAHQASVGDLVTAITLQARAHLIASLLIGEKGGNKLSVDVNDNVQIDVVLKRAPNEILHLSITRIELLKDSTATKSLELAAENWANSALNLALRAASRLILHFTVNGVNGWGREPNLNFPLDCLLGIALGPSGGCIGSDFSYDGTHVNPPGRSSKQMCRAVMDLKIKRLEISSQMSVHLVVAFDPWLEVTQLGPTDVSNSVQQTSNEWIGPIYRGKPMMYQSTDGRGAPKANYKDALDACIRDEGECGSVFGVLDAAGKLEYRLGRTTFPVRDDEDLWAKCADEGEFCHFTDDETLWGNATTKHNMWDYDAHGGHTDPVRMMRLRFGAFETPTDYIERTAHDDGRGVPCRRDFFGLGLQTGDATGFSKAQYCKRLTSPTPTGAKCTTPESDCLAHGRCALEGVYCPLERPCVVLRAGTSSPILGFGNSSSNSSGMKSSAFCIQEEVDGDGNRVCPRSPASKHCWGGGGQHAQAPFTQPVEVVDRQRRSCTGSYHLPCYLDIHPSDPPPPLDFHGGAIPAPSITASLPTEVLNSALATIYNTGILQGNAFFIPALPTIKKLCEVSQGFLCLASMWGSIKDETAIKLQLQMTAPGKVLLKEGKLVISLALQLSIHAVLEKNLGLPVERMLLSKKKCVRKEGVLSVSWKNPMTKKITTEPRWVEIEKTELKTYTVHGRGSVFTFPIGSYSIAGYWSAERDAKNPLCIKLKKALNPTHRVCSESPETTEEWFTMITSNMTESCDNSVFHTWGRSEAARLTFGLEAHAGVEVEQSKYLCVRPDQEQDEDIFVHIGTLHTRSNIGQAFAKTATGTIVRPLLNFIVETFGLLKPMLIWNLQSLAAGAGLKTDPPPHIEIRDNRIFVSGEVVDLEEEVDGGFQFNMSATNPCLRPGDVKPSMTSRIGSVLASPFRVLQALNPMKMGDSMSQATKNRRGV